MQRYRCLLLKAWPTIRSKRKLETRVALVPFAARRVSVMSKDVGKDGKGSKPRIIKKGLFAKDCRSSIVRVQQLDALGVLTAFLLQWGS